MNQAPEARPQLSPEPVLKCELKEWSAAEPWEKCKNEDKPRRGGTGFLIRVAINNHKLSDIRL